MGGVFFLHRSRFAPRAASGRDAFFWEEIARENGPACTAAGGDFLRELLFLCRRFDILIDGNCTEGTALFPKQAAASCEGIPL